MSLSSVGLYIWSIAASRTSIIDRLGVRQNSVDFRANSKSFNVS